MTGLPRKTTSINNNRLLVKFSIQKYLNICEGWHALEMNCILVVIDFTVMDIRVLAKLLELSSCLSSASDLSDCGLSLKIGSVSG